jgi:2-polyprenyl-3-methyl-5-hydroxy-6-metoxy-1,4-benzoquinol methylase
MAVSRLEYLSERYGAHNRRLVGRDFVWGGSDRFEPLRRAVGGPGRRVLDLGCRDGALTRHYAAGNHVVGLDVDRVALAHAARHGIETVWADVEDALPFEDESFDVVVAAEVLEHCREPRLVVDEAARVLRLGGPIAGSVPNAYRLKNRLRFLAGRPIEHDPLHLHIFRPRDVRALLDGFEAVQLSFVAGRFVRLHEALFANAIVFTARKAEQR